MNLAQEKRLALILLLAVLLCHVVLLWPEVSAGFVPGNDNIYHLTLLQGMVDATEHGANPLDFWSPESGFGSAVIRTYQPLAHGLTALAYFALLKSVSLPTLLEWTFFLAILAVPLGFYAMAWLMDLPPLTAAAAALLAPLIASIKVNPLGLDIRSWLGFGVFSQCVATSLLLVTLGILFQAIVRGRRPIFAGAMLGLTCLAHLMYGWMGALAACLLAVMPAPGIPRIARIRRVFIVGCTALVLTIFQLVPILQDSYFMNHTPKEPPEKWDSFGAGKVLSWLFTGPLIDGDRIPVLSLLAFLGAGLLVWGWWKTRKLAPAPTFVLLSAAFWILVFFGRPTWGPLLLLLGVTTDFHLHRVTAFVQLFLLMLAAFGLAAIWRELARRYHVSVAVLATVLLLIPLVSERGRLLADLTTGKVTTKAAYDGARSALDSTALLVKQRGGRVYAGLPETWMFAFKVGGATVAGILSSQGLPMLGFLGHNLSLPSDLNFDELTPTHYRIFNVRSMVGPAMPGTPPFLTPVADAGQFRVYDAPGGGYFDLVDVTAAVQVTRFDFFGVNDRWLHSDWAARKQHLWIYMKGGSPPQLPRTSATGPLPPAQPQAESAGAVRNERQTGQVYQAELDVTRPSYALFKMTWHPNWVVYLDGQPQKVAQLSPGFPGVAVTPGHHQILCRYEPGNWRLYLAMASFLLVGLAAAVEWRKTPKPTAGEPAPEPGPVPLEVPRKKRKREKSRRA